MAPLGTSKPFVVSALMTLPGNTVDLDGDTIGDVPYSNHCFLYFGRKNGVLDIKDTRCYQVVLNSPNNPLDDSTIIQNTVERETCAAIDFTEDSRSSHECTWCTQHAR